MQRWSRTAAAMIGGSLFLSVAAWAQTAPGVERYTDGPHMMWWGGGWYGMAFGHLFMILVLAAVIALAVLLVRWLGGPWHGAAPHTLAPGRTPMDILKERFARGEIDKADFEERRRVLED